MKLLLLVAATTLIAQEASCNKNAESCNNRIPKTKLSNGVEMPLYATGQGFYDPDKDLMSPDLTYRSVSLALDAGVNHIDTALVYRSQRQIASVLGQRLADGTMDREDIFITSKVYIGAVPFSMKGTAFMEGTSLPIDSLSPEDISRILPRHFERCLEELGVGYIDLMLLHWPAFFGSTHPDNRSRRIAAWKVLEDMYQKGFVRAIGVSNFSEIHLQQLMDDGATIPPMVNQIEASIYLQYQNIIDYCKQHEIALMAFSPLGNGVNDLLQDPVIASIADKYERDPGQIALRYLIQKGFGVVVRTRHRHASNLDIFQFQIEDEDMAQLQKLQKTFDEGTWGIPSPYTMT